MIKKVVPVVFKVVAGCFLFYLLVTAVVLPLALKWGAESQGSKILGHPVKVVSVMFDPFFWRLDVRGLKVLDADGQVMAGFDRLGVDASFLALLKKEYRVESLTLDGLKVNVALLGQGRVNLMDLVPVPQPQEKALPEKAGSLPPEKKDLSAGGPVASGPLPRVAVDLIALKNGQVDFTDQTVAPRFHTVISAIDVRVTGFSTDPAGQVKVVAQARVDEKGGVSLEGLLKPFVKPLELETTVTINSYALTVLTPYVGKYTGHELADGRFDLRVDYRIADNKLTASHKILIQDFTFGNKVESKDALGLPFGLVLALLEDANGQIKVSLPVTGDMSSPKFRYWPLVGQVARDFLFKIATKPFAFLGSMLGSESGTDEMGYVRFAPGKAELASAEKEKLAVLVRGLKERPKLRLEISGSYDPDMDWRAIQTEVLAREYSALRRESTGDEMKVYEALYQRSFGVRAFWAVTKKYKIREGEYDAPKAIGEMKRQLIEKAPADRTAMAGLATARARALYDEVMALGLDAQKVGLGANYAVQGSMGYVPLELKLTVFDDKAK